MFGYGFLAVVLVLYLDALGLDALTIGLVLTLTLVGDTLISLWLTTQADRIGRRRVLVVGAALMVAAGVAFAVTDSVPLLILAATIGVISPTGNEVGPFLAVEQAALSQTIPGRAPDGDLRLVQPGRLRVATATGALRRGPAQPGPAGWRAATGGCLPRHRDRLRRDRARDGDRVLAARRSHRSADQQGRRRWHPAPLRARALEGRRPAPVAALLDRCVRRRVHPAEPDGLLVPSPVRRRAGGPWRHLLRREPAGGGLVALGGEDRGADRA